MGFLLRFFFYGTVVSSVGLLVLSYVNLLSVYRVVHNHVPGPCHVIPGIENGAEDVDILPNGLAIFSTGLRWSKTQPAPAEPSGFVTLNISMPEEPPKKLKINGYKGHLNFHGISLFVQDGKTYVYAVNHPPFNEHPPADTVEKFHWDVERGVLNHEKTFNDPEFVGLNDLVVVKMDQFYISNLQTFRSKVMREIEMYLFFLPAQNVLYFDGTKATVVLPGMFSANGVDVSADQKYLYVAEVNKKRISSYRIDDPTTLVLTDRKFLDSCPDNINVNRQTGDLWIGAHPSMFQLAKRLSDPSLSLPSPSQVIRVTTKDGKFVETHQMFADNGHQISSSSSAAFHKGESAFVVGSVDDKAVYCKCLTCK